MAPVSLASANPRTGPSRSLPSESSKKAHPLRDSSLATSGAPSAPRNDTQRESSHRLSRHGFTNPSSVAIQAEFRPGFTCLKAGRGRPANSSLQQKPAGTTPTLGMIQLKASVGVEAFRVNLQQKVGGWPLPKEVQAKMESALGADFSDVRIHVGSEVPSIGAIAFTWGSNIHFAPGYYNPHTPHGQRLLAHELTHVVQQRVGRVRNPFGNGVAVVQDRALEAEADRMAQQFGH